MFSLRRNVIIIAFCMCLLFLDASCEIHRVKSHSGKKAQAFKERPVEELPSATEDNSDAEDNISHSIADRETWFCSIIAAFVVGLSGIFPLMLPFDTCHSLKEGKDGARFRCLLSFAVGSLLGDVFLHLLPEAWAHVISSANITGPTHISIGLWVIFGLLLFMILEKILSDELRNREKDSNHKCNRPITNPSNKKQLGIKKTPPPKIQVTGYLNLFANFIDNFTHGLAVAGGFLVCKKVGVVTTFAIMLHEIPHEIGDFAILLRAGFDRKSAARNQVLTASGGMLGVVCALAAESAEGLGNSSAWVLPFTSGGFIFISLVTIVPELLEEQNPIESAKQIFFLCVGIAVMFLVSYFNFD